MATLSLIIDKSREEVFNLVNSTVKEQDFNGAVTFGHLSENGQQIKIIGETSDLEKLKTAFEKKGETADIHK
jgi:hypothetical protein